MGSGFSKMKKQARAMQEQYAKAREEMQNKRVEGTSGSGLVTVTLDGEGKMKRIAIKPECVDKDDLEGLQDLILAAYENASKQLEEGTGGDDISSMLSSMPFSF